MNKPKKKACPKGDSCPECYGLGFYEDGFTNVGTPRTKACRFAFAQIILDTLDTAWGGLSRAAKVDSSPLSGRTSEDLYITGSFQGFRSHLKHTAVQRFRSGSAWGFQVSSDSDLITAWLASVAVSGKEILDPDAASVSTKKLTLVDLVDPPDLLVIYLGVKTSPNTAMPKVLEEAIRHRMYVGKATWVYGNFDGNLRAYSDEVLELLGGWPQVVLDKGDSGLNLEIIGRSENREGASGVQTYALGGRAEANISSVTGTPDSGTRRVERPDTREPKKKKFSGRGDS